MTIEEEKNDRRGWPEEHSEPSKLPDWIITTAKVEIYEAGSKLKLYYSGDKDAIYKFPGAFFGLTPSQVMTAIKQGKAKAYTPTT